MNIILKHILRNIKKNKVRSFLIIFSLIITSTLFILNITMPREIATKLEESIRIENGQADIEISNKNVFNIDDLQKNNQDINYTGIIETEGTYKDTNVSVVGYDIKASKDMNLLGEDVPDLKEDEVVINDTYAQKYNYHEGDTISLTVDDTTYNLKLVKIVAKKGATYQVYDNPYFVSNLATVAKINKTDQSKFNVILIDVKDDTQIEDYATYLQDNNESYTIFKITDYEDINEQVSYISNLLAIIAVICVIMIFFVISSLNKIIMTERMPVIGTFRSIGATKSKMNFILILENALYGLIGGVIGSVFGSVIIDKLIPFLAYIPNMDTLTTLPSISLPSIILSISFTVILEIIISLGTIIKTNKKSVKEIMFETVNTRYEYNKYHTIIGLLLFILSFVLNYFNDKANFLLATASIILFLVGLSNLIPIFLKGIGSIIHYLAKKLNLSSSILASQNISHNKMSITASKLIVISLSCALAILTVSSSISRTFESFRYNYDFDILVDMLSKKSEEYNYLYDIEGVEKIEYLYYYYDLYPTFNDKKFDTNPIILGIEKKDQFIKELDTKIETLKDNELLIDERYAQKNNILKGDKIKLKLGLIGYEQEYLVAGYINSVDFTTARNCIVINLSSFKKNITDIPVRLSISLKDDTDIEQTKNILQDKINEPNITIMTYEEFIDMQEESIGETLALVYTIVGLAVFLSFIGIINNQIISFIERKKELAILNSICMSKQQIKKLLIVESLIINTSSCLLSLGFGFLMTNSLRKVLESMTLFIEMNFNLLLSFKFIIIIFLILLITLIVPIIKLRRLKLIDEIKYE